MLFEPFARTVEDAGRGFRLQRRRRGSRSTDPLSRILMAISCRGLVVADGEVVVSSRNSTLSRSTGAAPCRRPAQPRLSPAPAGYSADGSARSKLSAARSRRAGRRPLHWVEIPDLAGGVVPGSIDRGEAEGAEDLYADKGLASTNDHFGGAEIAQAGGGRGSRSGLRRRPPRGHPACSPSGAWRGRRRPAAHEGAVPQRQARRHGGDLVDRRLDVFAMPPSQSIPISRSCRADMRPAGPTGRAAPAGQSG